MSGKAEFDASFKIRRAPVLEAENELNDRLADLEVLLGDDVFEWAARLQNTLNRLSIAITEYMLRLEDTPAEDLELAKSSREIVFNYRSPGSDDFDKELIAGDRCFATASWRCLGRAGSISIRSG